MTINAIRLSVTWPPAFPRAAATQPGISNSTISGSGVEASEPTAPIERAAEPVVTPEPEAPAVSDPAEKEPGVLRLLQEGHFRGVAAMRLRINFADALQGEELPEPVLPKGRGKAFDKFAAQYEAMQPPGPEEPSPTEPPIPELPAAPGSGQEPGASSEVPSEPLDVLA